jgi:hypothetical protein
MCRLSGNVEASASWTWQGLSRPAQGELYLYSIPFDVLLANKSAVLPDFM